MGPLFDGLQAEDLRSRTYDVTFLVIATLLDDEITRAPHTRARGMLTELSGELGEHLSPFQADVDRGQMENRRDR